MTTYTIKHGMEDVGEYTDHFTSLREFLIEVNKHNRNEYHPDVWCEFYVDGNLIEWGDFEDDGMGEIVGINYSNI